MNVNGVFFVASAICVVAAFVVGYFCGVEDGEERGEVRDGE